MINTQPAPNDFISQNCLNDLLLEQLGNGNGEPGRRLFSRIAVRLMQARLKHPVFARNKNKARAVIAEEAAEFYQAVEKESEDRQIDEALDVIATCCRFILGEYLE